jgi:hypothetical protein
MTDHEHHPNMLHAGCMPQAVLVVEVGCTRSCCNRRFVPLAAEGASQVSSEVCDCCRKVERMELGAGGSKSQETEVQTTQIVVSAGHMTIDG